MIGSRLPQGAIQELLKTLRKRAGFSVRDVAKLLDVPVASYAYYETPRYKKPYIPVSLADKLSGAFSSRGVDPADLYALAGVGEMSETLLRTGADVEMGEREAVPYEPSDPAKCETLVGTLYQGKRPADLWLIESRALELVGLLPGDVAVVVIGEVEWKAGDVVCAQIYDWRAGTAATVFRVYEPPYLVAASTDPRFRRPELVDDDRVVIKGVVVASYRKRRP